MVLFSQIRAPITGFSGKFLSDDGAGAKVDVNVKTPTFVFTGQRKPDGKTSASLKLQDSIRASGRVFNVSSTLKTGDVQNLNLSTDINKDIALRASAVARDAVINDSGVVTDNAGAGFGLTYKTGNFGLTCDATYVHQKETQLEVSSAGVYRDFTFGAKTKLDVQKQDWNAALKNLELNLRGDFGAYSTFLGLKNDFKTVQGAAEYRIPNTSDRVVAETEFSTQDSNSVKVSVGVEKNLPSGATTALRLNNDFVVGAVYKTRVNPNLVASVAANVNTKTSNTRVGLNLDFTF